MRHIAIILALAALAAWAQRPQQRPQYTFDNDAVMVDTQGQRINCHGGGLLQRDSVTYWYGEHRPGFDSFWQKGVSCYSTKDFRHWKNEGIVFATTSDTTALLGPGCIIERPKCVYNPKTGKYVLWFHHELPGQGYAAAHAGVAVSDSPTGPFELVSSARVNPGVWPLNMPASLQGKWDAEKYNAKYENNPDHQWWTDEWRADVAEGMLNGRDHEGGQMARDMTIFVDDDGTAYHIYSAEENLTLNIAELNDSYTGHTGRYITIAPAGHNEAPVVFKHGGKYWMVTSGCTGWAPNKARYMWADDMLGDWTVVEGTPFIGPDADTTYGGQGTFAAEIDGKLVFMADRWTPRCLADSRNLWLPILFDQNGTPVIPCLPRW